MLFTLHRACFWLLYPWFENFWCHRTPDKISLEKAKKNASLYIYTLQCACFDCISSTNVIRIYIRRMFGGNNVKSFGYSVFYSLVKACCFDFFFQLVSPTTNVPNTDKRVRLQLYQPLTKVRVQQNDNAAIEVKLLSSVYIPSYNIYLPISTVYWFWVLLLITYYVRFVKAGWDILVLRLFFSYHIRKKQDFDWLAVLMLFCRRRSCYRVFCWHIFFCTSIYVFCIIRGLLMSLHLSFTVLYSCFTFDEMLSNISIFLWNISDLSVVDVWHPTKI